MALTKLTTDLNYHQALSDKPSINEGLSPTQLKQRFDQAANDIKTYLNTTLTTEVESTYATTSDLQSVIVPTLQDTRVRTLSLMFGG